MGMQFRTLAILGTLGLTLTACGPGGSFDSDLRGFGGGFSTSNSAGGAARGGAVTDPYAAQGGQQIANSAAAGTVGSSTLPAVTAASSHVVAGGETAWSIARRYGVGIDALAQANNLPADMSIRTGQRLVIPGRQASVTNVAATSAPGVGSPTPQPPSARQPLPGEKTQPASAKVKTPSQTALSQSRTAASSSKFAMPVGGSIIRPYQKGKNEGIDISAMPGSPVKAAGGGTVAAITRDVEGVPIVVVRHTGGLMTVYAGLDGLKVGKGDSVSRGQTLGVARPKGVVHFEVRQGFDSVDPMNYL